MKEVTALCKHCKVNPIDHDKRVRMCQRCIDEILSVWNDATADAILGSAHTTLASAPKRKDGRRDTAPRD